MFEPLLDEFRARVSGERALETLRAIASHHRIQASPGYESAAHQLAGAAEAAGLEIEWEEVAGDGVTRCLGALMPEGWECMRATAVLHDRAGAEPICDFERENLSLVQRSAPASGRFPIVALEDGTEDDQYRRVEVRGKVVLTSGAVHRVHRLSVVERGAAGVLSDGRRLTPPVREAHHDRDSLAYTSFWWSGDEPRGWGFVVSPARGAALRERLGRGERLELEVAIESRRFTARIPLLSGLCRGEAPGEVLIVSHLCHPQPGANDNASGVAAALESARALAAHRSRAGRADGRTVRFLWMPEFYGTCAWLARDPARAARIGAALNLDMVGEDQAQCGSTQLIEHPPCFAGSFAEELLRRIRARARDWVTSYSGPGHYSLTRTGEVPYSGGSDHAVLIDPAIAVPCPMLIQWPDRYYHSSYDTPERCDPASLALAARTAATYAAFLAGAGAPERRWLAVAVGQGARRRVLGALEGDDAARRVEAERRRGRAALASLGRLGDAPGAEAERERLESFAIAEAGAVPVAAPESEAPPLDRAVPERPAGPLDPQRHLLAGWQLLSRDDREAMRRFEASVPGGPTALEVAWHACDGRRTVDDIARLVWLETGRHVPRELRGFFNWTARLGISGWREGGERG